MQVLYFDFDLGGSLIFFVCVNSAWIVYEQMDSSLKSHRLCKKQRRFSSGQSPTRGQGMLSQTFSRLTDVLKWLWLLVVSRNISSQQESMLQLYLLICTQIKDKIGLRALQWTCLIHGRIHHLNPFRLPINSIKKKIFYSNFSDLMAAVYRSTSIFIGRGCSSEKAVLFFRAAKQKAGSARSSRGIVGKTVEVLSTADHTLFPSLFALKPGGRRYDSPENLFLQHEKTVRGQMQTFSFTLGKISWLGWSAWFIKQSGASAPFAKAWPFFFSTQWQKKKKVWKPEIILLVWISVESFSVPWRS